MTEPASNEQPPTPPPVAVPLPPARSANDRRRPSQERATKTPLVEAIKVVLGGIAGLALAYCVLLFGFDIDLAADSSLLKGAGEQPAAAQSSHQALALQTALGSGQDAEPAPRSPSENATTPAHELGMPTDGDSPPTERVKAGPGIQQAENSASLLADDSASPDLLNGIAGDPFAAPDPSPAMETAAEHLSDPEEGDGDAETEPRNGDPIVPQLAGQRQRVPPKEQQTPILAQLKGIFSEEYAAAVTPELRGKLALLLRAETMKVEGQAAATFVMLREAYELALLAGDYALAEQLARELDAAFDLDFSSVMFHLLTNAAKSAKSTDARLAVAIKCLAYVPTLLEMQRFAEAVSLAATAEQLATRIRDVELRRRAEAVSSDADSTQRAWAVFNAAKVKLEEDPDNAEANLIVGRYFCCSAGDWTQGLPLLAKGSDPSFAAAAKLDLVDPADPSDQLKVADAWYEAAKLPEAVAFLVRARFWYDRAAPGLAGLDRVKAEKRLQDLAGTGTVGEAHFAAPAAPQRPFTLNAPPLAISPFDAVQAKEHQRNWAEYLSVKVELTNSIGIKLALIPPGEFLMGSPENEVSRDSRETQHRARITQPFYLGLYEVTHGEYRRVMGTNPSFFSSASGRDTSRFPVENVSWEDAVEFCRQLSAMPAERSIGRVYRLPTEAEWEYGCRAGTTTPFSFGSHLNGREANCDGNSPYGTTVKGTYLQRTTTVGSYAANGFGLYDVHGNVWEWCADWFAHYVVSVVDDPTGPTTGSKRVLRGGDWSNDARLCRSATWGSRTPGHRLSGLGFRVALSPIKVTKRVQDLDGVGTFDGAHTNAPAGADAHFKLVADSAVVNSVAFSPDGTLLASAGRDGTVKLWAAESRRLVAALSGHTAEVWSVAFSPSGHLLASASTDATVRVWDVQTRKSVVVLKGHTGPVCSVAFSPDGRLLGSSGKDKAIRYWDVATHRCREILQDTSAVWSIKFSPDGRLLASTGFAGTLTLWTRGDNKQQSKVKPHTAPVRCAVFSPDGSVVATASVDGTVTVWDIHAMRQLDVIGGYESVVCVAISPDGKTLAYGGFPTGIVLWSLEKKQAVRTLNGHQEYVVSVAFSPDGKLLASGAGDHTVRLWPIQD